jgi:cold shock CspA family protein
LTKSPKYAKILRHHQDDSVLFSSELALLENLRFNTTFTRSPHTSFWLRTSLEAVMPKGKVKKIGPDQKFGFILPEDNSPDVFFHPKSFPEEVRHEGVEVEFELDPTPPQPGKQRRATKVTLADLSPSPVASPSGLGVKWEKFGHLRKRASARN